MSGECILFFQSDNRVLASKLIIQTCFLDQVSLESVQ